MAASREKSKGALSRARVIEVAGDLLRRKGYNGTGLSHIIKKSATPKGSLYFHFPGGKVELTIAALKESGTDFGDKLYSLITLENDPGEAIEIACNSLAQDLLESNYEAGCPLATVTLEAAANSEPIRLMCEEQFQNWEKLIEGMLLARGVAQDQANQLAVTALSCIEGALILCRAYKKTEPLEKVGRQLKVMLAMVLSASASKS